jgi:hypothetical protein
MPSNPLTQEELNSYAINRILNPEGYTGLSPYMPAGYFLSTPPGVSGPALWRLFDASFISTGIIDPNRLGTGALGAGNLYLADDGTWKAVSTGGGGGDMYKSTYDVDNDGVVDSAERTEIIVRNSTGVTLTKGQVVYLSGATGNRPNAVLSKADTEATSSKTIGIVEADIPNNSDGYVATNGTLHNLDTSAFADGTAVWLSAATAGAFTSTVPAEPNHTVFIGYVARAHPTAGRLVILIQNGYELNELHGVLVTSEANNDLLTYESASGLWKNKTFSAIFGGTPLVSVPTLAQVTTAGNTTTNAISVGSLNVGTNLIAANSGSIQVVNFRSRGFDRTGLPTGAALESGFDTTNNRGFVQSYNTATSTYLNTVLRGASLIFQDAVGTLHSRFAPTTNNFLINTATDAGYKLDVNGTIKTNILYTVTDATNTSGYITGSYAGGYLNFFPVDRYGTTWFNHYGAGDILFDTSNNHIFRTNYVDALIIRNNGNVLINTATDAGYKLNVNGTLRTVNSAYFATTSGNVGIGTTSPRTGKLLDVVFSTTGGGTGMGLTNTNATGFTEYLLNNDNARADGVAFIGLAGSTSALGNMMYIGTREAYPLSFYTALTERMRIFSGGNVAIGTPTDAGQKLQVSGNIFIKGTDSLSSTKVFEVQNGAGASVMDFRNATYAFFGCGQGGGSNSGFIFRYDNTSYVQFTGYNYGAGSGAYKPILMDTDVVGRGQGIFINFGVSTNPPPNSDTEFAVRGRGAGGATYAARFRDSSNNDVFAIKDDGQLETLGITGYTGTLSIPTNPPGSNTITITNGLITNIA